MRSTIIAAAAFAASAVAVPYANPEVVTAYETDVVYVTNIVTVTAGAEAAAATIEVAAEPKTTEESGWNWDGWHWPHQHHSHTRRTKTRTMTSTSAAPPPPPPTSTKEAPPPPPPTTEEPAPPAYTPKPSPEPAPTTAQQVSPAAQSPNWNVEPNYQSRVVVNHNVHRYNHSCADVEWDEELAATAAQIASSCVYEHNTDVAYSGGGYGQNIAAGVEPDNVADIITDLFYNGEIGYYDNLYGQAEPSDAEFELWGHFSQIVWKDTKKVGCATQHCPGGLGNTGQYVAPYFTVCNYFPFGNMNGTYDKNVLRPKGEATVFGKELT